jgi:hypothetical protein
MMEDLTLSDIDVLLESLEYSRMNITHGSAPYEIKQPKLEQVEGVMTKLRRYRDELRRSS